MGAIFKIWDEYISPAEDEGLDIGSSTLRFKDLYLSGNAYFATMSTSGDITLATTYKVIFRDAAIYINSTDDGHLDLVADTSIDINALLVTTSGIVGKITTVTDTYSILSTDGTVVCNKLTAFAVTLPTAVAGQKFNIKNINTGIVTVYGAGSDLIDDVLTIDLEQWECVTLQCYAANKWAIL